MNEPLKLNTLKNKIKEIMRSIRELEREGKIDEKASKELNCSMGQLGYELDWSIKSAVQGLLEEIEKERQYANIMKERDDINEYGKYVWIGYINGLEEAELKVKKWFPVVENERD